MNGFTNVITGTNAFRKDRPMIHIRVPIDSTVQILLDGITIKTLTPNLGIDNSSGTTIEYYYSCPSTGTYTIVATKESSSKSGTVSVLATKYYNITLTY